MLGCDNCDGWNHMECTGWVSKSEKGTKFSIDDYEQLVSDIGDSWKKF